MRYCDPSCLIVRSFVDVFVSSRPATGRNGVRAAGGSAVGGDVACAWQMWRSTFAFSHYLLLLGVQEPGLTITLLLLLSNYLVFFLVYHSIVT